MHKDVCRCMHAHVCLETVMYVWRLLCSAVMLCYPQSHPCGCSPVEMTSPSSHHECGVRQGCSHCQCSPSPHSLKSAAAPPVPGWPWLEFQPLQGAEQLWVSIPLEGGKGAATLPQQGISCIKQLGADWAQYQVSEELTFYLVCLFPRQSLSWLQSCIESSLLPTPRGTVSIHQGAKLPWKCSVSPKTVVTPPVLAAATHQLLLPGQTKGAPCCQGSVVAAALLHQGMGVGSCFVPPLLCTRASVKWEILSWTLIYLEKDMSLNIESFCNETNTFQTAVGLSYPLKYSCGGVTWNVPLWNIIFIWCVF